MDCMDRFDVAALGAQGLNLHAVLALDALPDDLGADLRRRFDPSGRFRQLILVGNGGRAMWSSLRRSAAFSSAHPIDEHSLAVVSAWFTAQFPQRSFDIIYPRSRRAVPLQALGRLVGWHQSSPLGVGINAEWGLWFAYRVVLLADTELMPTKAEAAASPCATCAGRDCIATCPAGAAAPEGLALEPCIAYRKSADSRCRATCVARLACPVGTEHRYDEEQLRHCYSLSLQAIERTT